MSRRLKYGEGGVEMRKGGVCAGREMEFSPSRAGKTQASELSTEFQEIIQYLQLQDLIN